MADKKSSKSKSADKPYPEAESSSPQAGKVAEGVATYAAYATPMPKTPARTIAGLAADNDVWSFVTANNLLPYLETAIGLVRETFSTLREIKLAYEPDPELAFFNAVVIYVKASGAVEELFEQENGYVRSYIRYIPLEHSQKIVMLLGVA